MTSVHRHLLELIQRNDPLVSRYRINERVGAGAYGMIFRATDETTGECVAVKAISPSVRQRSSTAIARFQRELAVVRNLLHPNIISLYDWGRTEDGLIFMILEFVDGQTLDSVVRERPMSLEDAIDTTRQIASALQTAHSKGVIHRDLKPANVMVSPQHAGGFKVKVLDFGMAKVLEPLGDESLVDLTREGVAVGTPRYIAPEQARGLPVGPAADLYCTGLLLYEMLTGVQAVQATTVEEAVAAHVSREPLKLDEIDMVPPVIHTLLYRLLEKDPERRVQSADELLARLDEVEERQRRPLFFEESAQIGPPLGDMTGDFPGAGGEREQVFEASDFQPLLGAEPGARGRRSLTQRLFGGGEKIELDYSRFQTFAKRDQDPVMRRRREYRARWLRLPRTQSEWVESGLTAILVPLSFIIVGAQGSSLDFMPRVALALAAPLLALIWATLKHSEAWSKSFGRLGWVSALGAILIAHLLGPAELAAELTRNPTWFLIPLQDVPGAATVAQFVRWFSEIWAHLLGSFT